MKDKFYSIIFISHYVSFVEQNMNPGESISSWEMHLIIKREQDRKKEKKRKRERERERRGRESKTEIR